jgi:hypothetical protein
MSMQEYRSVPFGSTKVSVYFVAHDAATPFQPKAALAFNSGGIVCSYSKKRAARVAITPVTQTVAGAWAAGGLIQVDATNMPGLVRLDVPDAAFAPDGVSDEVIVSVLATGFEPTFLRIPLVDSIKRDATITEATTRTNN